MITRLNLVPGGVNYDSIIFGARLFVQEDNIYWSPDLDWSLDGPKRDTLTWISAKKLRWREVDWLGSTLRYGPEAN
jgi:hypothetical protein